MSLFGVPILAGSSMTQLSLVWQNTAWELRGDWPGQPSAQAGGLKGPLVNMSIWVPVCLDPLCQRAAVVTAEAGSTFGS